MATAAQIAANRRNAQKSTGPRTKAGKARSRLNGLKHGLCVRHPVMPAPYMRVAVEKYRKAALARGLEVPRGLTALLQMAAEVLGVAPAAAGPGGQDATPTPAGAGALSRGTRPSEPAEDTADGPTWVYVATTHGLERP
ncbi:hypothetical protein OJF2_70890 [Aquisphaera giovannonii]|uniref:Uncharacterized protein n=1 Tax=Aquisphaera giovannonii TaxID=406548 RepID=A0A5B9WD01_9BACT|nr:hypothetical protein [Aquisphaera giovannonii]QEH38486.1 hypothetical protein OJF2_70890 [Aquisphaera giovannonii]